MASGDFYYQANGGTAVGPVSSSGLKQLAAAGAINRATLIRQGDAGQWIPAERANGLFPPVPLTKPAAAADRLPVVIVDIDIPIRSLMVFFVRWAIASIPAAMIVALIFAIPFLAGIAIIDGPTSVGLTVFLVVLVAFVGGVFWMVD